MTGEARPRRLRYLAGLLAVLSCGDGAMEPPPPRPEPPPPEPPRPTTVLVSPSTLQFGAIGETAQLRAEVRDQNERPMTGVTVTWASSDPAVATVDATGLVRALADGSASITATAGSATGQAAVTVMDLDRAVLVTFYRATAGESWRRSDNWLSDARTVV